MSLFLNKSFPVVMAGSLMLAVSACGGSDSGSASSSSTSSSSASEAANEAETAVANVAVEAEDGVEEAADMVDNAADKVANATQSAANDAQAAMETAAQETEAAVENAAVSATETAEAVATSAGNAANAAYAALTGDAAKGRRVFAKCMACHTVQEGQNRVGPSLYGVVGREAGTVAGFNYSDANANSGITWTEETLFAYLENPQEYIPGTRMIFPGLPAEQDRADVIAYLKSAAE